MRGCFEPARIAPGVLAEAGLPDPGLSAGEEAAGRVDVAWLAEPRLGVAAAGQSAAAPVLRPAEARARPIGSGLPPRSAPPPPPVPLSAAGGELGAPLPRGRRGGRGAGAAGEPSSAACHASLPQIRIFLRGPGELLLPLMAEQPPCRVDLSARLNLTQGASMPRDGLPCLPWLLYSLVSKRGWMGRKRFSIGPGE